MQFVELSGDQVELARWLSHRYVAPLFDCVAAMLPPAYRGVYDRTADSTSPTPAR